ncbi:MAG: hypothetical protein PHI35_02205, partial [Victivallaceae bacterium]|nr:hypothetical protein [Victivallaceae bacterium]
EAEDYSREAVRVAAAYCQCFMREDGTLKDSSDRGEPDFCNYNFFCELNGSGGGCQALARFRVSVSAGREVELYSAAFGPYRVKCNGKPVFDDRRAADWSRPFPAYAPDRTKISLRPGVNVIEFETDNNFLNWDLFFRADGIDWGEGELYELSATGAVVKGPLMRKPRRWRAPAISQTTCGYAAFAGIIGQRELKKALRDEYYRDYVSIRVPLFCQETEDTAKLSGWVMPPNTPWTMFFFLSGLFENGLADEALALLRKSWGVMLDRKAENTWEEWNCHSSLCHAWGASPSYFFHREILGVKHETLNDAELLVRPSLFDLEFAEGRVMLALNEWLDIALERRNGTTRVKVAIHSARKIKIDEKNLPPPLEIITVME